MVMSNGVEFSTANFLSLLRIAINLGICFFDIYLKIWKTPNFWNFPSFNNARHFSSAVFVEDKAKLEKKRNFKEFDKFNSVSGRVRLWKNLSQLVLFTWNDIPAKDYEQVEPEG